ncbi:hypothetical protein GUITHDRAFT_83986 [Guillardia theta CCMP2712]|uniref:Mitochondrial processing peptidase beta subunit n=1 Tax=Guillardia theta (strain CCMP2712) TaxID=905079 RepID=L1K1W3_GUITC|nr:hypothetical protein GUITHDRAFT_83986 [Guillardia theta CCMP2712]EKX54348.1 hypothetical protein GUITHDRAFT_83986 [Guillardia theta CCMP2712]|eukprot:XP_005841328.1 hypothetical protein GUITHDRAFT_83986 [Guillardia theta CCMP2712]
MRRAGNLFISRVGKTSALSKRFASTVAHPNEADLYSAGIFTGLRKSYCGPLPPSYQIDPALLKLPATKVTTLPNGMRVATEKTPGESVAVGVFIKSGSRYETDDGNGSAHFLEHMFFKGSKNSTQGQFEKKVEQMGCRLNAYTSREQTVYYANVLKKDVGESLNILSEMLLNSTFDPAAIEREKKTILQEMEEVEKLEEEVVFDNLHYTAYQTSPLGRTILGTEDNIKNMTRDLILNYIQANYIASRMVIVAAGPVEHDEFVNMVSKAFAATPTTPSGPGVVSLAPAYFTGSDIRVRDDEMQLAYVATAWETVDICHADSPATMVMQAMLGSFDPNYSSAIHSGTDMVSLLAGDNPRGYPLVQSAMTFNTQYSDTGLFGVYYVAEMKNVMEAQWAIFREFQRLVHSASDEKVELAKTQLKSTIVGQLDSSLSQVCEDIGRQMLNYGRRLSMAELFARIDAVDAPTVRRVAADIFDDKCIAVSAKGNISTLPDYLWLRRHTWSLRY